VAGEPLGVHADDDAAKTPNSPGCRDNSVRDAVSGLVAASAVILSAAAWISRFACFYFGR
jgi:hypothetical protein